MVTPTAPLTLPTHWFVRAVMMARAALAVPAAAKCRALLATRGLPANRRPSSPPARRMYPMTCSARGRWLVVSLWAVPLVAGAAAPPTSEAILGAAVAAGLGCTSCSAPRPVVLGYAPVSDCPGWSVRLLRGDFMWTASLRADDLSWVTFGGPPLLRSGQVEPITGAADAAAKAAHWFRAFGFSLAGSECWDCWQPFGPDHPWRVELARVVAPDTLMRPGATVELDGRTGALVRYRCEPPLRLLDPLPPARVTRAVAIEQAVDRLRRSSADVPARLVGEAKVLRVRRVFFYRGMDAPMVVRSEWRVDIGGLGEYFIGPTTGPRSWSVAVQDWDGAVFLADCHRGNHRFILGREVEW